MEWHLNDRQRLTGRSEELNPDPPVGPSHSRPPGADVRRAGRKVCRYPRHRDCDTARRMCQVRCGAETRKPRRCTSEHRSAPAAVDEDRDALAAVRLKRHSRSDDWRERFEQPLHEHLPTCQPAVQGISHGVTLALAA